ncbi:MAG: SAM-dependent methyltransferase [Glaciecola sp.]|jgi:SAM-dependent methyltransferase
MATHPKKAGIPMPAGKKEASHPRDLYRIAAPIYDACTSFWSGRAIWNSRRCQIAYMKTGSRALYAGGGQGRAAIEAAQAGVQVTLVDRSPAMLRIAKERARKAGVTLQFVQADLAHWTPPTPFDHVVANHLFNVFHPASMAHMRQRLIGFLADSGCLHVADFRPLHGHAIARGLQRLHHIIPLSGCAALTRNAMHPIYDHGAELKDLGWCAVQSIDHRIWSLGPAWYRTWIFRRAFESEE